MSNPLTEGLRLRRKAEPCVLAIFGASGDLTRRKLFPALYALAYRRVPPPHLASRRGPACPHATDPAPAAAENGLEGPGPAPLPVRALLSSARETPSNATPNP